MNYFSKLFKTGVLITLFGLSFIANAVEFSLFGDAKFSDNDADGEYNSFSVGALDFFASARIDDNTRAFVEYVFENGGDGLVTDLERIWVTRTVTDNVTVGMGRFHAPLGHWNRTYHHGGFMQDTISRPFFLDFEDGAAGVLPVHVVGIFSTGNVYDSLSYEAFVANGTSIDTSVAGFAATATDKPEIDINDAGDPNANKMIGFRISYAANDELTTSFFALTQTIADSAATGGIIGSGEDLIEQMISGIDIVYVRDKIDFVGEFFNFNNDSKLPVGAGGSASGSDESALAYYIQLGYWVQESTKLSFRHSSLSFDKKDDYFRLLGAGEAESNVLAARYNLSETSSLTLQITRMEPEVGTSDTASTLQWSFMVP